MPRIAVDVTTQSLEAFADAWNRHDVDALKSFMTEELLPKESPAASEAEPLTLRIARRERRLRSQRRRGHRPHCI